MKGRIKKSIGLFKIPKNNKITCNLFLLKNDFKYKILMHTTIAINKTCFSSIKSSPIINAIHNRRDYHVTIKSLEDGVESEEGRNWNEAQKTQMMKKKRGERPNSSTRSNEGGKRKRKSEINLFNQIGKDSKKVTLEMEKLRKHVLKAESLLDQSNFEEALQEYEKAMSIPLDYHTGAILMGMGICYMHLDDHERCIDTFVEALEFDPDNISCYNNLAHAYFEMEMYDESLETYKKALELMKDDIMHYEDEFVEINFHVGQIYLNVHEDNVQAIEWFDRALMVDPNHGQVLHFKAVALQNIGEDKKAKKLLLFSIENSEFPFPESFYLLHKIFEGEGDSQKSSNFLQEYLEYQERLKQQNIPYEFN